MSVAETSVQAAEQAPVAGFDESAFAVLSRAAESDVVRAAREESFRLYQSIPMPTSRMDEWRRTDPARFPFPRMAALPALTAGPAGGAEAWDELFDVVISVSDRHFEIRDVSGALAAGKVQALSIDDAARSMPDVVRGYLRGDARGADTGKFEALNDAFWNVGLFVRIPDGVTLEKGILLRVQQATGNSILVPRLVVVLGERAEASIVERLVSPDDVPVLSVMSKEIYLGQAARLRCVTLREWGSGTYHLASDWARLGRDARVDWITLNFGGKVCKMRFGSDGSEPGSSAELDGLYFATGEQHFDQKTLQVHSAANTYSRLLYKGVVKDKAYSVYQGLIVAKPGAIKVDAYQKNNNLVLNDGARADSLPGLKIDADDLKCSHGSTVGNLDEAEVFYLRSRGVDEKTARKLLIRGFFEEVIGRIPFEVVRETVQRQLDLKIG